MLTFSFKNYDEFKELFVREDGKRKNKVLLAVYKDAVLRKVFQECFYRTDPRLFRDTEGLYKYIWALLESDYRGRALIIILGHEVWNDKYSNDNNGVCFDGDFTSIRYYNVELEKTYKMKIGKMINYLLEQNQFTRNFSHPIKMWFAETATQKWESELVQLNEVRLVVDDDFKYIYDADNYTGGNFGSCMSNRHVHTFYNDAVSAKAASLRDDDNRVLARCVIYTDVYDQEGRKYRLAERQYCGERKFLKRLLVKKLIDEGYIDGYKACDAGCGDSQMFYGIDHNLLPDRNLHIECNLELDDNLSYQDSFKYYDLDSHTAYNYERNCTEYRLDTTDGMLGDEERNYDEYHDEYVDCDLVDVYYNGNVMTCAEDDLDDFIWIGAEGMYIHEDDVSQCEQCGDWFRTDRGYYSDYTSADYCCCSCKDAAEDEYKEQYWFYAEADEEYFENESDITTWVNGLGEEGTISWGFLRDFVDNGWCYVRADGVYAHINNREDEEEE